MKTAMRSLDWDEVTLAGVVERESGVHGLRLARLPQAVCREIDDPMLSITSAMAAGMRLCLSTDATDLELEAVLTGLRYAGGRRRTIAFDLCIDHHRLARQSVPGGGTYVVKFGPVPPAVKIEEAPAELIAFRKLPKGMKQIEIWLPHNAEVELTALRINAGAKVRPWAETQRKWIHYGSSISHGKELDGPVDIWPVLVARETNLDVTALGFSGQCMLDGSVARVIARRAAAVISLELGVNVVGGDTMRGRTFRSAVHNLLDIIRDQHPTTPVVVVSPIVAPILEEHPGPALRQSGGYAVAPRPAHLMDDALTVQRTRAILADCVALRRSLGDRALHCIDGQSLLGALDADRLLDGLHPDEAGHRLIAERFAPLLKAALAQPAPAATGT